MAVPHNLPSTYSMDTSQNTTGGPFQYDTSKYALFCIEYDSTDTNLRVFTTTDPSSSDFTLNDTEIVDAGADVVANMSLSCCVRSITRIGCLFQDNGGGTPGGDPYFSEFLDGTGLSTKVLLDSITVHGNQDHWSGFIGWDTTNSRYVIAYQGDLDKVMGVNYRRVDYGYGTPGSWTVGNRLDYGDNGSYDANSYENAVGVIDGNDYTHFQFHVTAAETGDSTQLFRRTLDAASTPALLPSSHTTVRTWTSGEPYAEMTVGGGYNSGGERAMLSFWMLVGDDDVCVNDFASATNPTDSLSIQINDDTTWSSASYYKAVSDGSSMYMLFEIDNILYIDKDPPDTDVDVGSGWYDGANDSVGTVGVPYTRNSTLYLPITWQDTSTWKFQEIDLDAAFSAAAQAYNHPPASVITRQSVNRGAVF